MRALRSISLGSAVLALSLCAVVVGGCKSTHEQGVTSDLHSQWVNVAADTQTTTSAAKDVLEADKLKDVTSTSTAVDGMASGKKSDGTKVKVDIQKDGMTSKVSVTVGTLGDPTLGASIARRIKDKAESK